MINTLRIDYETMKRWQNFLRAYEEEDEVEVVSKLINEYIDKKHQEEYNKCLLSMDIINPKPYIRCQDCDDE